jgi:TRAP-type C4-dicarboxylate transport system permease large subunit
VSIAYQSPIYSPEILMHPPAPVANLSSVVKPWQRSKTILFNAVLLLFVLLGTVVQIVEPTLPLLADVLPTPATSALMLFVGVANIVLRVITRTAVSLGLTLPPLDAPPHEPHDGRW